VTAALGGIDAVALAQALIRCPSVTPRDAGVLDVLAEVLAGLGFECHRLTFSEAGTPDVANLYARRGRAGRNFCFAGHTDVVPAGDLAAWTADPFGAAIADGVLYGRGAADMKGAIAAFVSAAAQFLAARGDAFAESISLLITGDEEGPSINGTRKVLDWLAQRGERLDACIVGEPTNPQRLGEMVKIGRRGNLYATLTVRGIQGHTAYPQLADNPVHHLVAILAALLAEPLDQGSEQFEPSSLQIATIDVGNAAKNVIPAEARATLNIRFSDRHTGASLTRRLEQRCAAAAPRARYDLSVTISGEAFLTPPGALSALVADAIAAQLGIRPVLSTTGGTSDARFIKSHCPVVEFGLIGQTMHKVDERIALADLADLTAVYRRVLDGYFASPS
jgi:succinyl-diaminopimelate desuccinylase